jgi:hypothetical protein
MSDDELVGVIADRQILDLTSLRTPQQLEHITGLQNIQVIAVPEPLAGTVGRIPQEDVLLTVTVPDGARVRSHTGLLQVGGEAFSGPNAQHELLVVVGALVFTTPVTTINLAGLAVVGGILAPKGSENALGGAVTQTIGSVGYYRYSTDQNLKVFSGQSTVTGTALANVGGTAEDILIAAGQLLVTGPVTKVGYQDVRVMGQAILPRSSQDILGPILQVAGQVIWYGGDNPRLYFGNDEFGRQLLELFDEPATLIVVGRATFQPDVTAELVKEKVAEIVLFGKIEAPRSIIPVLQYLTTEKYGSIVALEDSAGDPG